MKQKVKTNTALVKIEREVWIHGYLLHASKCFLKEGREQKAGSDHQLLASLMFLAFGFDAYLNWLVVELFPDDWESLLHKKAGRKSLPIFDLVTQKLNVSIDRGCRPAQTLESLTEFRNIIAHGKRGTEKLETVEPHDLKEGPAEFIKTPWEKFCTLANAERVSQDVNSLVTLLHAHAGLDGDPFSFGYQTRSATFLPPGHRHKRVKLERAELFQRERDRHEVDGWTFFKIDSSPEEGFSIIFTKLKGTRGSQPRSID